MVKKEVGFSRMIWLKPTIFYQLLPPAKASGNLAEAATHPKPTANQGCAAADSALKTESSVLTP
jgi:hypothetical protein